MKNKIILCVIVCCLQLFLYSCKKGINQINDSEENDKVAALLPIQAHGSKLFTSDGKEFRAWGFNYGIYEAPLLIEQYWDNNWDTIVGDFEEMKGYGANCIRLHIQYWPFMTNANTPDQHQLNQLKKLFRLAEQKGLYILLCGTNAFVKEQQPAWYTSMTDSARWTTQAVYWEAIAGAIGKSNALLGYDLMNEPVAAVNTEEGWTPGTAYGGYYFVQNIALNKNGYTNDVIFQFWIAVMTQAIRKKDTDYLITVGFLPFATLGKFTAILGMGTTHIYPKTGEVEKSASIINAFVSDKPLIISETFPLECSSDELQEFISSQNHNVNGWIWHYTGKTIEALKATGTIVGAIHAAALEKFKEMAPAQK
ncbi:MAG: cellulase family glycosylhydrolase [Niabella sp.]